MKSLAQDFNVLIYHFLPDAYARDDLANRRIKISTFADLNDPFELIGVGINQINEEVVDLLVRTWHEKLGVLCLSRNWHNPLLWSHYADKHRGMCLGFEVGPSVEMHSVTYAARQLFLDAKEMSLEPNKVQALVEAMLLTKFEGWRYEDEVRLFAPLVDRVSGLYFHSFDEDFKLRKLIVGVRNSTPPDVLKKLIDEYEHPVTIIRSRLAFTSFEVVENTDE